jgi:hypothetical protein
MVNIGRWACVCARGAAVQKILLLLLLLLLLLKCGTTIYRLVAAYH